MPYIPLPPYNATYNLLQLMQQACAELGIRQPSALFSATDNQSMQLLALAQREGREFYQLAHRRGGWQELRKQYIFYLLPTDTSGGVGGVTATLTLGSQQLTNVSPSASGIVATPPPLITAANNGLPYDCRLTDLTATTITMDSQATISGNNIVLSFNYDAYPLPDDFAYFIVQTSWDRSFRWQLLGPLEAQEWQVLKSGISPTGPRRRFRIMGNLIYIDPPPTEIEELVIEYYSNSWCTDQNFATLDGVQQSSWLADTDYYMLDPDAFIMGIKWRWKAAKGLDYDQEKNDYDMRVERLMSRNGSARDLPLNASGSGIRLLNEQNIPDTGYGS